jgi:hypothetical protein
MKFNVNEYVRVRLTETGKNILRKKFDSAHERMPQAFKEFALPEEDEHGFSEWQMWHLFANFGEHIYLGCKPPFEAEIEIVEKAFQHSVHLTASGVCPHGVNLGNQVCSACEPEKFGGK